MTYWCVVCELDAPRYNDFLSKPRIQSSRRPMLKQISMFNIAILMGWPFISRIDQKPELQQFICRQKRYTSRPMNRPDRPSLSRAVALHCVRSRLKIMLFSWGHLRITTLSTKTGPGNNSKRVIGTQILSAK